MESRCVLSLVRLEIHAQAHGNTHTHTCRERTCSTASSDCSTATWREELHGSLASEKCTRLSSSPSIFASLFLPGGRPFCAEFACSWQIAVLQDAYVCPSWRIFADLGYIALQGARKARFACTIKQPKRSTGTAHPALQDASRSGVLDVEAGPALCYLLLLLVRALFRKA